MSIVTRNSLPLTSTRTTPIKRELNQLLSADIPSLISFLDKNFFDIKLIVCKVNPTLVTYL